YVITDLTSRQASPERIAKILRAHWVIENRLHFVRDTAFREDASKIRTGHSPEWLRHLEVAGQQGWRDPVSGCSCWSWAAV
ncbi:transposase, partial [Streptomyces sp. ISL-87]